MVVGLPLGKLDNLALMKSATACIRKELYAGKKLHHPHISIYFANYLKPEKITFQFSLCWWCDNFLFIAGSTALPSSHRSVPAYNKEDSCFVLFDLSTAGLRHAIIIVLVSVLVWIENVPKCCVCELWADLLQRWKGNEGSIGLGFLCLRDGIHSFSECEGCGGDN